MPETGGVKKEMRRRGILQEYIETSIVGSTESARRRREPHQCLAYISCTIWAGGSSKSNHAVEARDWVFNPGVPIERKYQSDN